MTILFSDVCIIGAGPVGLFSVFACGMKGLSCTLIDALSYPGGQCAALYPEKPIYDIPAHPSLTGQELVASLVTQMAPFAPREAFAQRVTSLKRQPDGHFCIKTHKNPQGFTCQAVILAAGVGCFEPNKPDIDGIETFEPHGVAYHVRHKEMYRNTTVVIMGGGDSAADWAIELTSLCQHVHLVHRRQALRTHPENQRRLLELQAASRLTFWGATQVQRLHGTSDILTQVTLHNDEGTHSVDAQHVIALLGLTADLSDMAPWGLHLSQNRIPVSDFGRCETPQPGIYAVGDVAEYPHKRRLIMTGFAEAEQAAHHIYRTLHPEKPAHIGHSSTTGVVTR